MRFNKKTKAGNSPHAWAVSAEGWCRQAYMEVFTASRV